MENNRWVSHIYPILTSDELHEYIRLQGEIRTVVRLEDSEDDIKWRWTPDDQYTMQSSYQIQFMGRYKKVSIQSTLASAKMEPKCQIFVWILLQHKILTANNLAK